MMTSCPKAGSVVMSLLAACSLLLVPATAADKTAEKAKADAKPAQAPRKVRDNSDRPVAGFLRSPAQLLMTPDEKVEFARAPDLQRRREYLDRFWSRLAPGCPQGTNPNRDLLQQRAADAAAKFGDEGVPGWLTDRGSIFVLLGEPAKQETRKTAAGDVLVWTYASPARTIAFRRERLNWVVAPGVEGALDQPIGALGVELASAWRTRGCELSPEERAKVQTQAWRLALYETAGKALAGEKIDVTAPVEPAWYFFPTDGESTLVLLTVPLDAPLPADSHLAAVLRQPNADDLAFNFGTAEVPFDVRPSGSGIVAQSVKAVPPGKYTVVLGVVDAAGQVTPRFSGEQLIVRLPKDGLRLTSVLVAEPLKPLSGPDAQKMAPFHIAGYEVVPRPSRVAQSGETITFMGVVLGAGEQPDLKITYQLKGNLPGTGWKNIGQPMEVAHHTTTVIARDLQIHPKLPATDYKLVIGVTDNKVAGATASVEVPFKIKAKD